MFCLKVPSHAAWAASAGHALDAILQDHAHCEMKAATNAMSLAARHPHDFALVRALVELAREELDHFTRVVAFLERRGLRLEPPVVDDYAAKLRTAIGRLPASPFGRHAGLVDRLLVACLIEARSCERFKLLLGALDASEEPDLRSFYEELFACEARHYTDLVELAVRAAGGAEQRDLVVARLDALAVFEGDIVRNLPPPERAPRATVHG